MPKLEMTIPFSVAMRLAKVDALELMHGIAEEAYRQGWEASAKDVKSQIESKQRAMSKGYEETADQVLDELLRTTQYGVPED